MTILGVFKYYCSDILTCWPLSLTIEALLDFSKGAFRDVAFDLLFARGADHADFEFEAGIVGSVEDGSFAG